MNPERLKQARELRNLTQVELAERVGVTQAAIAYLEAGQRECSEELSDSLAFALGFPPSFFRQAPPPDFPLGSMLFRARDSISARDKAEAHRHGQLMFECHERLANQLKIIPPRLPVLTDDLREPARAAHLTRAAMGLSPDTPIKNLIRSVEKLGVFVLAVPMTLEKREGFSLWVKSGAEERQPVIVLFDGQPGDRQRMTAAHELGHLELHSAHCGSLDEIEYQAYEFAAELLLPESAMRTVLLPPITLAGLAELKVKWGVALQTLIRRARDLSIITPRQYKYLFEQIGARGWRKQEPSNLAIPLERPRALRKMAELLYGDPPDVRRFASDMHLPMSTAAEMLMANADNPERKGSMSPRIQQPGTVHQLQRKL